MAIDFKKDLNEEQFRAVTCGDGACLVLAGAGSGKTRTITYRVAYLLERGVPPEQILLLTFTNKAAREMLDRVRGLMGHDVKGLWGGTFHTIGYRIVREHARLLDFNPHITILDSEDSRSLLTHILKDEGIDPKQKKFPSAGILTDAYSYSRNAGISIEEAIDAKYPRFFSVALDISHILALYKARKHESNFVDFDDLLCLWLELLEKYPEVRERMAGQFHYVLVDEYQDTNRVQAKIIKLMSSVHGNVLAVGDDAQSIYSFRAADVANILDFEREYKNARVFHLLTNYRSTPEILNVANEVIANNERQIPKQLKSTAPSRTKPCVHTCDTSALEAERIADEIARARRGGAPYKEIAVLFRSTFHSQPIEFELTRRGLPYDYRGGTRFFERAHVKDALAYLRAFASIKDSVAWQRMLVQQTGIGLEGAKRIFDTVRQHSSTEEFLRSDFTPDKRSANGWQDVKNVMRELFDSGRESIGDLIRIVACSSFKTYIENEHANAKERLDDIEQLAKFADYASDVKTFLAETALQEQYRSNRAEMNDQIVLSTIHQAKGLEWDVVFLINLSTGAFPNERAAMEQGGIEEERRLFYVGVTRARKQLFLSHSVLGGRNNEFIQEPSLFLQEISSDAVESKTSISHESRQSASGLGSQYGRGTSNRRSW